MQPSPPKAGDGGMVGKRPTFLRRDRAQRRSGAHCFLRSATIAVVNKKLESHIHRNSLLNTACPRMEKNLPIPMGDTWIGRHPKKYRCVSNGEKNTTPSPPLVIASSTPWLAVIANKISTVYHLLLLSGLTNQPAINPMTNANNNECVIPRCPHISP